MSIERTCIKCGEQIDNTYTHSCFKVPTERQSTLSVVLGVIQILFGLIMIITMSEFWMVGLSVILFGCAFASLGSREVIINSKLGRYIEKIVEFKEKQK